MNGKPRYAVFPPGREAVAELLKLSPGHVSGDHLFVTGMTGSLPDGTMPDDPETQFHAAFDKIGAVLAEVGLGFDALVDMTSYHIDIDTYFKPFARVRATYMSPPYPAWTAVEVAKLRRSGALVEIKVTARLADD